MYILSAVIKKVCAFARIITEGLLPRLRAFRRRYWGISAKIAFVVLVGFILLAIVRSIFGAGVTDVEAQNIRSVVVAPAATSLSASAAFEITGEIVSQTQGDLRTQRTGIVTAVLKAVGEYAQAGTIIATIENASERAGAAQARAGVAQAEANYNKVSGGTREQQLAVLAATTNRAIEARDEALTNAHNTLASAYAAVNGVFAGGVDSFFSDASGANPLLAFNTTKSAAKTAAEHQRFLLQGTIDRQALMVDAAYQLNTHDTPSEIAKLESEVRVMKDMLDALIIALDGAVQSASVGTATIASYKATATTGRITLLSTLSTLSTTRSALNTASNAVFVAKENEELGVLGAQDEDVAVAQAQLDAAQAALAQAYARLEDTYVRAPVSGVITRLSVKPGDFVSAYQDVGLVANTNSLEVQAFVSVETAARLRVGAPAYINRMHAGVITSVAKSIDPTTRQIEVHIAFRDAVNNPLPTGVRVPVSFPVEDGTAASSTLLIPLTALKLTGSGAYVFTVDAENVLHAAEVQLGAVVQDAVEILEGISRETVIVLDARGFNEGDTVIVTTR